MLNFNKKSLSKSVGEFFCDNLPNEVEHIKRIMATKKLPCMEANSVLRSVLTAMIATNSMCKEEISIGLQDDDEPAANVDPNTGEAKKPESNVDPKSDAGKMLEVPQTGPKTQILSSEKEAKKGEVKKSNEICHFYTINKCKFGKECRKTHPKICPKFKKCGLKKFNKNGCEESCTKLSSK